MSKQKRFCLKKTFIKWIEKEPNNNDWYAIFFIIIVGKWFLPYMILMMTAMTLGAQGIQTTAEQEHNMSISLTNAFVSIFHKMNEVGLNLSGNITGWVFTIFLNALPYLSLTAIIVVIVVGIRCCIYWAYKKTKKIKKTSNGGQK